MKTIGGMTSPSDPCTNPVEAPVITGTSTLVLGRVGTYELVALASNNFGLQQKRQRNLRGCAVLQVKGCEGSLTADRTWRLGGLAQAKNHDIATVRQHSSPVPAKEVLDVAPAVIDNIPAPLPPEELSWLSWPAGSR
jgi:hypothetical protein